MPELIPPYLPEIAKPASNAYYYLKLKDAGLNVLDQPYKDAELLEDIKSYYVLDYKLEKIVYAMDWEERTILGKKAAYQVEVWSSGIVPEIRNYVSKVFWEHLFNKNKLVCTDRYQTPDGKRLWEKMLSIAFSKGYYVYYYDISKTDSDKIVVKEFKDIADFSKYADDGRIWLSNSSGQKKLLLISETKLLF